MLDNALDLGISEENFWSMTFAELGRLAESKKRTQKRQAQERATFEYIQAQLVARGVASMLSGSSEGYPTLEEAYSGIFEDVVKAQEEEKRKAIVELSAIRFRQYANFHNKKFEEVAKE